MGKKNLLTILHLTDREFNDVLEGTLSRIDFFEIDKYTLGIKDEFVEFFLHSESKWLSGYLFKHVSRRTIPLQSHLIEPHQTDHILNLLKVKRDEPVHILLYGSAGTGKTSYALGIAKKLGIPGYEILREQENKSCNRRAAIIACLKMGNAGDGALVIVDEADNLLNTKGSWLRSGETQDKGWLNQLLEEPGSRMIWITNETENIEESVLRRFAFSLPFRSLNRGQKVKICESVLRQNKIMKFYSHDEISDLVKKYPVNGGIIDSAVKKSLLTCTPADDRFKGTVVMALDAYQVLQNAGRRPKKRECLERGYSLEGLNIDGDIHALMDQLEMFDRDLEQRHVDEDRNFNLLFYGPPGTGKSELARYIAEHLDRQLIVKKVSDILDCYVGETEKKIADAFYEAEQEDAVLVIDEADSFLFNRNRAIRSWEISHTNEFLTQMERFRGILICTTNRFEDLDQASVRRFNYKIGFRCLKPEGNVIFYKKLLSPLTTVPLNKEGEEMVGTIGDLTPGDFRLVRDRFAIFPRERVTHGVMIQALREESQIKKMQEGKKILGFMKRNS